MRNTLTAIFKELNNRIEHENTTRRESGSPLLSPCEIRVLGQMSPLANGKLKGVLSLQRTADLDALLKADYFARKVSREEILPKQNLVYDDSEKVWIPVDAAFEPLCDFTCVKALLLDAESALVSKAIKAPVKNARLIREAIASGHFPHLVDRIESNGGNLEQFLGE